MVVLLLGHRLRTRVPAVIRLPVTLLVCPPGNTPLWWPAWLPL
ncbi:hypothetical protein [Nocardia jiangsuensis]|uniref:Uncharacterized protein n=1 Tax=Nocardia jiangsuensis TaxID=1691563 RepID=A0ABV8E1S7_9NOCA